MSTRVSASLFAVATAVLVGCASESQSVFAPRSAIAVSSVAENGASLYWEGLNKGKKSIALNLS